MDIKKATTLQSYRNSELCVSHWFKGFQSAYPAALQHVRLYNCLLFQMPSVGLLLLRRSYVFLMALREAGGRCTFPGTAVQACGRSGLLQSALQAARGPRRVLMWKSVRFVSVFCAAANKLLALNLLPPLVFSHHFL